MASYVQIVSAGSSGLPPCVLVATETHQFLFNTPEQIQRFGAANKLGWAKIECLFYTECNWDTLGGFTDVMMTMADFGKNYLSLYGPRHLLDYIKSTQMSLYRPASCLDITEFHGQVEKALGFSKRPQKGEEQSEADVQVFPIVINSTLDPDCCPAVSTKIGLAYDNYRKKERESLENPFARIIREKQDAQGQDVNNDPSDVMCYAVKLADTRGKFDLQKAKALGVPPGPSFGKLTKGETIITPAGKEVKPSDCVGEPIPGGYILIVTCPTEAHIPLLLANEAIKRYHQDPLLRVVVHVTPLHVLRHPDYVRWTQTFAANCNVDKGGNNNNSSKKDDSKKKPTPKKPTPAKKGEKENEKDKEKEKEKENEKGKQRVTIDVDKAKVQHIFAHKSVCVRDRQLFKVSNKYSLELHAFDEEVFPLPFDIALLHHNKRKNERENREKTLKGIFEVSQAQQQGEVEVSPSCVVADGMMKYVLQPPTHAGFDLTETARLDEPITPGGMKELVCTYKGMAKAIEDYRHLVEESERESKKGEGGGDSSVLFLGTVASASNSIRCESGIYLDIPGMGGMLLDAGGGCYQQLVRRFGVKKTDDILRGLKCIWITHKHADHCAGLFQILRARKAAFGSTPVSPPPSYLTAHLPTHRSHPCAICGFKYSYKSSVLMHTTTHQTGPPNPMQEMQHINPTIAPPTPESQHSTPHSSSDSPAFAPCVIIGPMWLEPWLVEYSRVEPLEYVFVDGAELTKTTIHVATEFFDRQLGICKISAQIVMHSFPTYAIVMEHRQGWKLVYSGDTRPCPPLIELGKDATLLIHEATFEEDMQEKAQHDGHSTVREALHVAQEMRAEYTVLTHFSGRLEKRVADIWGVGAGERVCESTMMAFDFMTLPLNTHKLKRIASLMKPVYQLFGFQNSEDK